MELSEDFTRYTKELMGDVIWQSFMSAMDEEGPVSVRLNPFKTTAVAGEDRVEWCRNGYYLPERPAFTFDPLLHAGVYYVQEASSMFLDLVLRQYVSERVVMLDLCAAPGGKSTVARAVLPEGSLLVCNEPVRSRANILAENIQKFGHPDVIVTNNYPTDYRNADIMFDVILADVPCSGEGMFRKDEVAIKEWSVQKVEKCHVLQREIVTDIWGSLKAGGLMIYSTCTYNTKEDEENIRFIAEELGAEILPVEIKEGWNITGSLLEGFKHPVCRFIPGMTRGEGLFMAVLRKSGADSPKGNNKKKKGRKANNVTCDYVGCLKCRERYGVVQKDSRMYAIPDEWKDIYDEACKSLRVIHAGVELCEMKGKDAIPSQSLALSASLDKSSFPIVELDYRQAIRYLRKEPVALPDDVPHGMTLVAFRGFPLGFAKNIGNRANNLYPNEWKIRSAHVPETYDNVIIK